MQLSEFEMLEKDDKRLKSHLLLIYNKLTNLTIVDIDASLRKAIRWRKVSSKHKTTFHESRT